MYRQILLLSLCGALPGWAALHPVHLRCEYLTNPTGIEAARPRLSWVLESRPAAERNRTQSAYRIVVSSAGGTVWDSGKTGSGAQAQVEYAGKPLEAGRPYEWKVQVWDDRGRPSGWSETARWSMGLIHPARWAAQWIFDPAAVVPPDADAKARISAHSGYCSRMSDQASLEKWVGVDLGAVKTVDAVRLWPARAEEGGPSYLFPRRYTIEVASDAKFTDARIIVDRSKQDQAVPPPDTPLDVRFAPVATRFLRLVRFETPNFREVAHALVLAEMEVLAGGVNVAAKANVIPFDNLENAGCSRLYLTDGRTAFSAGAPPVQPVSEFRRSFQVGAKIKRAVAYATARGVYQLRINGKAVDDRVLAPDFTDYARRIQYQTYDVTSLLAPGENVAAALVGAGWYSGRVGLYRRHMYGTQPQLLVRLEIELANGQTLVVVSDPSWKRNPAPPIVSSDMLDGEWRDARREAPGWDRPGFSDAAWPAALADPKLGDAVISAQRNEPIRPLMELKPQAVTEPRPGVYIYDMGQNMVGWCRIAARGQAGSTMKIRFGEALSEDGSLYTINLRGARQTDQYTFAGSGQESFEPLFTYHGFRYVEVSGAAEKPTLTGRVIHSAAPAAGQFKTSDAMLNRLMANILWSQRGNLYSVPTDCPQRDERLGWMGDAQTFSQTMIFNMDMAAFFTKWILDIRDDQAPTGQFPDYAPNPGIRDTPPKQVGAPAWGDAGVIVPWRMWQNYADRRLLAEHYEAARRWVDFIEKNNPNGLWLTARAADYNDWVNGDFVILDGWPTSGAAIPKPIFATAFWAHSTDLLSRMAAVLEKKDDAERYAALHSRIKAAFNREWVKADGRIEGDTQASYALALHFNLLPPAQRAAAMKHLLAAIDRYKGHLSTGIHATSRLMLELTREGRPDTAYHLAMLKEFPSWGFMIENGATTIWERWDGYIKGRGFQNPGMNSLNHWAFGSVGEWMWRTIVGLNPDDAAPGWAHFEVRPVPGGGLTSAEGSYDSIRGPIRVAWDAAGGFVTVRVSVPPNARATVYVPTSDPASVTEGGKPVKAVSEVGSGEYTFRARL
ncbi:MAG: family 78 glycoside hydrolase catalytic domain [Acidobacteria bacterium]|nr:family 78 glycoside hydrolase catalytic domain [Acidobacteriota bacterium]